MVRKGHGTGPRGLHRAPKPHRGLPWRIPVIAAGASLLVIAVAAFAALNLVPKAVGPAAAPVPTAETTASSLATSDGVEPTTPPSPVASTVASAVVEVELPDVVGKPLATAEMLLQAAGLRTVTRVASTAASDVAPDSVVAQAPGAGTRLRAGDTVTLTYQPRAAAAQAMTTQAVVVIDAGHQAKADLTLEPIGPGSTVMKEKVRGGATGVATGIPEYEETLAISLKLRERLQAAGVKVIMVRTTNDVNIANSERARIGNRAGAALTVRIHLDSATNQSIHGISCLYPSGNSWVTPIQAPSKRAADIVETAAAKATGQVRRGIFGRSDMSGFNWSTVPTIIVECAFMSNPGEDRTAATPAYQDKVAAGIAAGVMQYLKAK